MLQWGNSLPLKTENQAALSLLLIAGQRLRLLKYHVHIADGMEDDLLPIILQACLKNF